MDREALLLTINELHRAVEAGLSPRGENVRPLIGVSANQKEGLSCINNTYIQSVADAGGARGAYSRVARGAALAGERWMILRRCWILCG